MTPIVAIFTFLAKFMEGIVVILPLIVDKIRKKIALDEAQLKRIKDAEAKEEADKAEALKRQASKEARNIAASKARYDSLWQMKHDTIVQYLKDKQEDQVLLLALGDDVELVDAILDNKDYINDEYKASLIVNILRKGA